MDLDTIMSKWSVFQLSYIDVLETKKLRELIA